MKVELQSLENGLRLAAAEVPGTSFVDIAVAVRAGSRYENAAQAGMAHLVEHALGRGSINYPSFYFLSHALESLGDLLDSDTYAEHTRYWIRVQPDGVERTLAILADLFAEPVFKDVDEVKSVVFAELDAGAGNLRDRARALMFGPHALGRPVTGSRESLRNAAPADLLEHFRDFYQPDNMAIAAAGAIRQERFFALVKTAFGPLRPFGPSEGTKVDAAESGDAYAYADIEAVEPEDLPAGGGPRVEYLPGGGGEVEVALAFVCAGERDENSLATEALARALGDGGASRLRRAFFERLGLARPPVARLTRFTDVGMLEISFRVATETARVALQETFRVLRAARNDIFPIEELDRLRARMEREAIDQFEDSRHLAQRLAKTTLLGIPMARKLRDHRHAAIQLPAADLKLAAERILTPPRMVAVLRGELPEVDRGDVAQILAHGLTKGF